MDTAFLMYLEVKSLKRKTGREIHLYSVQGRIFNLLNAGISKRLSPNIGGKCTASIGNVDDQHAHIPSLTGF